MVVAVFTLLMLVAVGPSQAKKPAWETLSACGKTNHADPVESAFESARTTKQAGTTLAIDDGPRFFSGIAVVRP